MRRDCSRPAVRPAYSVMLLAFALLWPALGTGCRPTPQVLENEAMFSELDALYTAVTTRKKTLVADCRLRLTALQEEGKLSRPGLDRLAEIISLTDKDDWETAARRLHEFMRAQRRPK